MRYIATVFLVAGVLTGCGATSTNSSSTTSDVPLASNTTTTTTTPTAPASAPTTATKPKQPAARHRPNKPPTPKPPPPKPAPPQHECVTNGGANRSYSGLYGTVAAFQGQHNMAAPTVPTDGIAWYTILSTEHGCVTSDSVDEFATPQLGASDIMFLTEGIDLPDDHNDVHDGNGCSVFISPTLTKASGYKYAVVTGFAQEGHGAPAHAEIQLTNDNSCPSS